MSALQPKSQERTSDDVLFEHFLNIVKGAGREFGPDAALELRRIFYRARATGNANAFTGYVARLMMADASANGWL